MVLTHILLVKHAVINTMQSGFHAVAHLERAERGPAVLRGVSIPIHLASPCQDLFSSRVNTQATSLSLSNGETFQRCAAYITPRIKRINVANNTH